MLIILVSIIIVLGVMFGLLKDIITSKLVHSVIENNISQMQIKNNDLNNSQLNRTNSSNNKSIDSQNTSSNNNDSFTDNGLSIYDSVTNKNFSLGMSKDEVDKLLETQDNKNFKGLYNYQGLEVFYRDNKVAGLVINASKNETGRFKISKNIGLGSTKADISSIYGESIEKNSDKYLTYFFEKKDNSLVKLKETPKNTEANATKNVYCVFYSLFGNGKVSMILIGDYQYAMNMK